MLHFKEITNMPIFFVRFYLVPLENITRLLLRGLCLFCLVCCRLRFLPLDSVNKFPLIVIIFKNCIGRVNDMLQLLSLLT